MSRSRSTSTSRASWLTSDEPSRRSTSGQGFSRHRSSIGIVSDGRAEHRHQHDLHVPEQAPIVDVIQVVFYTTLHFLHGVRLTAPTVDLCPARDTGFDLVPKHVAVNLRSVELVVGNRVRARPDYRHAASQRIQELG